jgi:hypothetical protein
MAGAGGTWAGSRRSAVFSNNLLEEAPIMSSFDFLGLRRLFAVPEGARRRVAHARSLVVESLESRLALSALIQVKLETTDTSGNPISSIAPGGDFVLRATVQDLRPDPTGVFAAYFDVTYDPSLVSVDGAIAYGAHYPNGHDQNISTPGLLDEVGAFDSITPLGGGQLELFTLPFHADAAGTVVFAGDPADLFPDHFSLIFDSNDPVPVDQIEIVNATLVVEDNTPQQVSVDIKQGSINLNENGVIPLVLFGSSSFDVTQVDRSSLRFAGAAPDKVSLADVNGDGHKDLVLKFRLQDTNLLDAYRDLVLADRADGQLDSNHQTATVSLTGQLLNGQQFAGQDTVDLFLAGSNLRKFLNTL